MIANRLPRLDTNEDELSELSVAPQVGMHAAGQEVTSRNVGERPEIARRLPLQCPAAGRRLALKLRVARAEGLYAFRH